MTADNGIKSRDDTPVDFEREIRLLENRNAVLRDEIARLDRNLQAHKEGIHTLGIVELMEREHAIVKMLQNDAILRVKIDWADVHTLEVGEIVIISQNRTSIIGKSAYKPRNFAKYKIDKDVDVSYSDIIGLDNEVKALRKAVEWILDPEFAQSRKKLLVDHRLLDDAGSVLLFGPPGTGKTYMAKAVAGSLHDLNKTVSFIKVESYELVSKWLGESALNIKELFKLAREVAPTILFMDEIDAIGRERGETTTDAGKDVAGMMNQMLTEIGEGFNSNKNMAIIFSTNFPQVMDPALLSRIRKAIYVPPPHTKEDVRKVLDIYTAKVKMGREIDDEIFSEIWRIISGRKQEYKAYIPNKGISIAETYFTTPRDIKNVIQEAVSEAAFEGEKFIEPESLIPLFKRWVEKGIEVRYS